MSDTSTVEANPLPEPAFEGVPASPQSPLDPMAMEARQEMLARIILADRAKMEAMEQQMALMAETYNANFNMLHAHGVKTNERLVALETPWWRRLWRGGGPNNTSMASGA